MKTLLALFLGLIYLPSFAQCDIYMKEALIANSFGHSISNCSDGGSIIAGVLNNGPFGDEDWIITKRNSQEETVWTKAIGTDLTEAGKNLIITEMPDGYIIGGYQTTLNSNTRTFVLVKLNTVGDILWQKRIPGAMSDGDTPRDILITENLMYVVGTSRTYGPGLSDAIILCFEHDGEFLWGKTMGGEDDDHFYSISNHSDGKVIIAGNNESFDEIVHHNWVLIMDSLGNTWNEKIIFGNQIDTAFKIEKNNQGNFSMVGYSKSFGSEQEATEVIELDQDLNILSDFIIDTPYVDQGIDIIHDDGHHFVVANSRIGPNQRAIHLYNLANIVNDEVHTQYFSISGNIYNELVSMLTAYRDHHLSVICTIQESGESSMGLLKFALNDCGAQAENCPGNTWTDIIDVDFNIETYNSEKINFNLFSDISLNIQNYNIDYFNHCETIECEGEFSFNTNDFCSNSILEIILNTSNIDESEINDISWDVLGDLSSGNETVFTVGNENEVNVYCEITTLDGLCTYIVDSIFVVPPPEIIELNLALNSCEEIIIEEIILPFCFWEIPQEIAEDVILFCQEGCSLYELAIDVIQDLPPFPEVIDEVLCDGEIFEFNLNSIDSSYFFLDSNSPEVVISNPGTTTMEFGNGFCTSEMLFNISVPEEPIIPDEYYAFCEFPANPDLDPTLDLFFNGLPVNQTELNSEGTYTYSVNNDCYDVSGNFEVELLTVEPISIDAVLCEGESFVLSLGDFNVYSIDNPENEELIFQPDNSTEFQLSLLDLASDCPVSLTLSIDVINEPQWSLPPDTMLCEGTSLSITWPQSFDLIVNDSLYNNSIGLTEPAQLYFVSENECFSIEHWMQLEFEECSEEICDLYFPNAITTNDDLRNDLFYGKTACEWNNFQLQIYNRWGEKIFETDDINHKWPENDEDIPIGVYVWQVRCSLNESIEPLLLKGHVTVIE